MSLTDLKTSKQLVDDYISQYSHLIHSIDTPDGRLYSTPDGNIYPSVGTILGHRQDMSWLNEWKNRIGEEEYLNQTKYALDRGTSMHSLIEDYLNGKQVDSSALGFPLFKQLRNTYLKNLQPLSLEIPLYSDRLRLGGRADFLGFYKNRNGKQVLSIVDFKSSKQEKQSSEIGGYFLQSTLYSMMTLERINIAAKQIVILIGVDNGLPQEFIRPVSAFVGTAIEKVNRYHRDNDNFNSSSS